MGDDAVRDTHELLNNRRRSRRMKPRPLLDYPLPRFVTNMQRYPHDPDEKPVRVFVLYRRDGDNVELRCWLVHVGSQPELRPDRWLYRNAELAEDAMGERCPDMQWIDPIDSDAEEIVRTWL